MWGSFWKNAQWGYACCHSFLKNSYCIGAKGHEVNAELAMMVPVKSALDVDKSSAIIDEKEGTKSSE